jgi:hypothetical protein
VKLSNNQLKSTKFSVIFVQKSETLGFSTGVIVDTCHGEKKAPLHQAKGL